MTEQEWLHNHRCLTDPITRYVLMACKRRDVPASAVFMSEVDVVDSDNNRSHYNNPVSWAVYFGFVPPTLKEVQ